ncbi:ECF transporter S component [bacterium]|nr:ECF transporter S component [bacterium]
MKKIKVGDIVLTALFVAIGVLLPIAFHTINMFGIIFLPMHIPVILCGFICGPLLGGVAAIIIPLLSSAITGMPVIYPVAVVMVFELVTYAVVSGTMLRALKKINLIFALYLSLFCAMLLGRAVLGAVSFLLYGVLGNGYTFSGFIMSAFVTALPGIIIQLVIIPWLYFFLKKAKLIKDCRIKNL